MEDLTVNADVVIPGAELRASTSRSGGPGGQHVNKVNTKVTLAWSLEQTSALQPWQRARAMRRLASRLTRDGMLVVQVDDHRSQRRNLELARERLAELLGQALAPRKRRVRTAPSAAARRRRLDDKRRRSALKKSRRRPGEED
jgi:ribosome-associated protein